MQVGRCRPGACRRAKRCQCRATLYYVGCLSSAVLSKSVGPPQPYRTARGGPTFYAKRDPPVMSSLHRAG
jgi:hypothetical protein